MAFHFLWKKLELQHSFELSDLFAWIIFTLAASSGRKVDRCCPVCLLVIVWLTLRDTEDVYRSNERGWTGKPQQKSQFFIKHHLSQLTTALKWLILVVYPVLVHIVWCMCLTGNATGSVNKVFREDQKEWPLDLTAAWAWYWPFVDWVFCYEKPPACSVVVCVGAYVGVCVYMSDSHWWWCEGKSWGRWCRCLAL